MDGHTTGLRELDTYIVAALTSWYKSSIGQHDAPDQLLQLRQDTEAREADLATLA